jgi:hypothetical protein
VLRPDVAECSTWEAELLDYLRLAIAEALACGTPVLLPAELAVAGELITDQSTGACYTSVGHLLYLLASPPRYDLVSLHFGNLEIEQLLPARWRTLGADVPPVVVHVHALEPTLFTRHVPDPKLHAAAVQAINHAAGLVYFGRYARSSLTQRTPAVARLPHAVIWAWPCTASATPPARSMTDLGLLLMTRTQCYRSLRPGRRQRTRPLYPRHAAEQRRRIALPVVNPWTTPVDDRASVIGGDFERRRVTHAVEDHQISSRAAAPSSHRSTRGQRYDPHRPRQEESAPRPGASRRARVAAGRASATSARHTP